MKIKIEMGSVQGILKRLGLTRDGDVQQYWTALVNRRIGKYMPYRSGALSGKLKFIASPVSITVAAPYAKYQYFGVAMVDSQTGKGPRLIPGVGYRFRKGAILMPTSRPLEYDKTKHPEATSRWDEALKSREQEEMLSDMKAYIRVRKGINV